MPSADDLCLIYENLDLLESHVLNYESVLTGRTENSALVHDLFRVAHNLKSNLAMNGKAESSHLIHSLENNFDHIRQGKLEPDHDMIGKWLESIDLIRLEINDNNVQDFVLQARRKIDDVMLLLDHYTCRPAAVPVRPVSFALTDEEREKLRQARSHSMHLYQLEKVISSRQKENRYLQLPVFDTLAGLGTVVAYRPHFADLDQNQETAVLKILFATTQTEDTLKSEVFDPFFPVVYQEERQIAVIDDDPAFGEKIRGCFPTCRVDFYRSLEEHIQQLSARKLFMVICDISFIGRQVIERYRLLKNCPDYVVIKRFCTSAHMMPLFSSGLGRPLCFRKGNILMELYRPQTQGVNDG